MTVAQESESLAVNQKIRVQIPAATPHHKYKTNARDAEVVEAAVANPLLTGANALRGSAIRNRGAHPA